MIEGVDYSEARPGGANLASHGKKFAMRYVPYGGYSKGLTVAELKDLNSHGVGVGLVFESIAKRVLGGLLTGPDLDYAASRHLHVESPTPYRAGQADAWQSQNQLSALGMPTDLPIYFAVDFDATSAQQVAIDAYLKGAGSIIGAKRVGVYGGYWVIKRCVANGSAKWFWQTYAWSGGNVHPANHILQYLNAQTVGGVKGIDLCRAYKADFGQFPRPAAIPDTSTEDPAVIEDLKQQITDLKAKVAAYWKWIVSLRAIKDDLKAEVADLEAQVVALEAQVGSLPQENADLKATIKRLRERIVTMKGKVDQMAAIAADVADD